MSNFGRDYCIICIDNLATIMVHCRYNHRILCVTCYESIRHRITNCPMCRGQFTSISDATNLQLEPVTIQGMLERRLIDGLNLQTFNEKLNVIKQVLRDVRTEDDIDYERLHFLIFQLGNRNDIYAILMNDVNFHEVLKALDNKLFERIQIEERVRSIVNYTITSPDTNAIVGRAVAATIVNTATAAIYKTVTVSGDITVSIFSSVIFSMIDVYRWSQRELSTGELFKNIGEHVVGNASGVGGFYAGAAVGVVVGTAVPVVGSLVCGIVFGILGGIIFDASGRFLYRQVLPANRTADTETIETREVLLTPKEIALKASTVLGVDIEEDTYDVARKKYHKKLLEYHPDKNINVSADRRAEIMKQYENVIACWQVVSRYYIDNATTEESAFIDVFYLYLHVIRNNIDGIWKVTRTFYSDASLDRYTKDNERLDIVTLHN